MFISRRINASYDNGNTYVGGSLFKIIHVSEDKKETYICLMSLWTMGSCAARSLFQFDSGIFFDEALTTEFFEFLDEEDRDFYNSKNIYMFLSEGQVNKENPRNLYNLVEGLDVIDSFANVGNGGSANMKLFRWTSPRIDEPDENEDEDF